MKKHNQETPEEMERRLGAEADERRDIRLGTPLMRSELIALFENVRTQFGANGTHESDVIADFCQKIVDELQP